MLRDALLQLHRDLKSQKLRTLLTVFGLVWGTVAVTLLLAFGAGLKKNLIKQTAGLGDRICISWPGLTSIPYQGLGKGRRIRITDEDLETVRPRVDGLKRMSSEYSDGWKMVYNLRTFPVDVSGVSPEFGEMRNLIPVPGGRFLNPLDMKDQRRVVFLGNKVAEDVFGKGTDPVGKTVLFNGSPFLVIGVLTAKEQDSSYNSRDSDLSWIPGTTFRALTGRKYLSNFVFQPASALESKAVTESLRAALSRRLKFDPADKEAFSVWDTTEQFQFFEVFMLAFSLFLGIVGSLTLVVGGIGVSNIMNVIVDERTKEIGVKMALGAKSGAIQRQFIVETLIVTAIGGVVGFAISLGICTVYPESLQEFVGKPEVSPFVALITTGILGVIGFLAGFFPARSASRLDPVVAMKL
ncbi:MAG: ABC transporter permease [Holophagales bacterium]|nr:ABC transporter permease [Holophagales bacterium]